MRVFLGTRSHFVSASLLAPKVYVWVCLFDLQVCVFLYVCVDDRESVSMCVKVCVCMLMALW